MPEDTSYPDWGISAIGSTARTPESGGFHFSGGAKVWFLFPPKFASLKARWALLLRDLYKLRLPTAGRIVEASISGGQSRFT
jgi:hypothetical protein